MCMDLCRYDLIIEGVQWGGWDRETKGKHGNP